jgi:hypothetical protein
MSQDDLSVANSDGASVRADINANLQALGSLMSGGSAPGTTYAYMLWGDTGSSLLKMRNGANSAWVTLGALASTFDYPGKQTIWVPAAAMRPTVSNPAAAIADTETTAGRPDISGIAFDATSDEGAGFSIYLPKAHDDSTITFIPIWESTATDTDGVSWALEAVAVTDGATIDVAFGTPIVVDDANQSAAEELLIGAESAALTIGGTPATGKLSFFRIYRDVSDANDTATEDAILIGVVVLITTDAANDD